MRPLPLQHSLYIKMHSDDLMLPKSLWIAREHARDAPSVF